METELVSHPQTCGLCDDCREALADYKGIYKLPKTDNDALYWKTLTPVDHSKLARHIAVYGKEGTEPFLVKVKTPKLGKRAKLEQDVLALHAKGRMVSAIADELKISDRRVKSILSRSRTTAQTK